MLRTYDRAAALQRDCADRPSRATHGAGARVAKVRVQAIYRYVTDIAAASRNHPQVNLGCPPARWR